MRPASSYPKSDQALPHGKAKNKVKLKINKLTSNHSLPLKVMKHAQAFNRQILKTSDLNSTFITTITPQEKKIINLL